MKKMIAAASVVGILFYAFTSVIRGIVFLTSASFQSTAIQIAGGTFSAKFSLEQFLSNRIPLLLCVIPALSATGLVFAVISVIFLLRGTGFWGYAAIALGFVLAGSLVILLLPPQSYAIAEYQIYQKLGGFGGFGSFIIHQIASLLLSGALLMHILYFVQVRRNGQDSQPEAQNRS